MKSKRTTMLTGCAIGAGLVLGCLLLIPPVASATQQACSAGKLQGRYVFTGQGTNLHYGAFDFDGVGSFSGKQTSLRNKTSLQREALSGSYTLDADCTGTMTLEGQPGGTAHWPRNSFIARSCGRPWCRHRCGSCGPSCRRR